ncbi:MAG: alpha/beta fold hydrolase [Verrucomicrobiota bacterium]|jgi:dienelactone hydrolase
MKRSTALLSAFLISSTIAFSAPSTNDLAGNWQGALEVGQAKLQLLFKISRTPGGVLTGKLDSLDQGAKDIPVETVTVKDNTVRMEVKIVQGVYNGSLDEAGKKMTGTWRQGPQSLPLTLERSPSAVPSPAPPASASTEAEPLAKQFVSFLAEEDFQKAVACFDATMKAALPLEKLKETWANLLKEAGPFQKMGGTRADTFQQYRIVFVTCRFQKKPFTVKVVVDRDGKVAGLFFLPGESTAYQPPDYVHPSLFQEKEVVVGAGEWQLPGTLTMPIGKGPFPAAVLVQGSGPLDRDESIGPNKPFRDLAWGLASRGLAVLRYEKRTKHYPDKCRAAFESFTAEEETITDALAAVSLLRHTPGVNANRVFVLGHSLGGMLAPRIAASDSHIAGLIIMAGVARPLEDLVLEQTLYQASLGGKLSPDARKRVEDIKRQVEAIKSLPETSSSQGLLLGASKSYWLDLKSYNPAATASTLMQPMLILQGEKDCQVSYKADFAAWRQELAGRKNVKLKSYPTLNHLFMEVEGQSTGAEYELAGHVAENVIKDIADWIP